MELLETEIEIYNSKLRLFNWVYEEMQLFYGDLKEEISQKGKDLPINL
jgi:hypothetical protein